MADQTADQTEIEKAPAKKGGGKKSLLFGIVAAIALGGAGFYVTSSGLISLPLTSSKSASDGHAEASSHGAQPVENMTFVPLETIMVSLPRGASARHLKFTGELEVEPGQMEYVQQVMPRIQDVLNTYLRAVEVQDIEKPASATMLRAQMLRRVQVVTGEGRVRDVLVTEFVLN